MGGGNLSNFPVAVYWKWDGGDTLGIRMESPNTSIGLTQSWSFNVFSGGSSPGGLDSSGSNVLSISNLSTGGAFSETSLGAYGVAVDAIEATWTQPSSGGAFDPSLTAAYIQLTIQSTNGPSALYRMAEYLGEGGTYSDSPDIFDPNDGSFCATTNGTCALLTFQVVVADTDGDGVPDNADLCPDSSPDDIDLRPNQYAQNSSFGPFEVGPNDDQSVVYDMTTTQGCTCAQIIEELGKGDGHSKKGCSPSVMEQFTTSSAEPDREAGIGRR